VIKQIVVSLAVLALSGCVYYVPYEVAVTEPPVDEAVVYEEPAVVYESYVVSPYYPWASVDYFYLGNNYYRPYSGVFFSYGFYAGGGWYSPYYNPYYYSAWYQPFYGFPYPYYGAGYDPWYHHYPHHAYQPRHDDDRDGHQGGGVGRFDRGPKDSNSGNGVDGNARTAGHSSLDRHVPLQRQPGQLERNISTTPATDGSDRGMVIINRGDSKTQPSHTQPAGSTGYSGRAKPAGPVDLSGVSSQKGQPRTVQPGQNQATPARTGMPPGFSRPVPLENSGGKQPVVRQAPAEPAPQPSFNQQMAPQPVQAEPPPDTSRRPDGGFQRSKNPRDDGEGGFSRGDRDDD